MFGKPMEVTMLTNEVARLAKDNDRLIGELGRSESKIEEQVETISDLRDQIKELQWKMSCTEKENSLASEKKLNELRLSMQESLIKSDLLRTEALARLEVYEKTDTRADANVIKDMVKQLIDVVGKQSLNVIAK